MMYMDTELASLYILRILTSQSLIYTIRPTYRFHKRATDYEYEMF